MELGREKKSQGRHAGEEKNREKGLLDLLLRNSASFDGAMTPGGRNWKKSKSQGRETSSERAGQGERELPVRALSTDPK